MPQGPSDRPSFSRLRVAALIAFAGLFLTAFSRWEWQKGARTSKWPSVPGVVESAAIATSVSGGKHRTTNYHCRVSYRFEAGGATRHGSRIRATGERTGESDAREDLGRYPPGAPCTVHYDPADPTETCLEPGGNAGALAGMGLGVLIVLGGIGFGVWRRPSHSPPP